MKNFFNLYITYSKYIFKFIVTQVTMSAFGLLVGFAALATTSNSIMIGGMILSIGFLSFLMYDMMFIHGLNDSVKRTTEGQKKDNWEGLKIALLSYAPTIFFVLLFVIFFALGLGDANVIITLILALIHGTYTVFWYFAIDQKVYTPLIPILTLLPALVSCTLGYYLGLKELPIRKLLGIPINPPKTPKNKK